MYETSGNTAYSINRRSSAARKYGEQNRQYRKRHNAEPKRVTIKSIKEDIGSASLLHRQMAKQRIGQIFACILAVSIISAVFAGILYRNSNILEQNYANIKIEREIKRIYMENDQLKEEMAKKTDLALIRKMAVSRMGMQDPGLHQIVRVSIPVSDRIVIEADGKDVEDADTALNNTFNNIEGYFRTIR